MSKLLIRGGRVYAEGRFAGLDVLCEDGKIHEIGAQLEAADAQVIDAAGLMVCPGFIDAHTHGAANVDVNAADEAGLKTIAAFFATQGTTAFCASVLTDTQETTEKCLAAIGGVQKERAYGAQLLGAHMEGPFLASAYKGAMPEYLLRKGDAALLRSYQAKFPGVIRYITVSPEVEGVPEMIAEIADDVVVAIGHSGADYATSMQAIENGARCITHTFNAMRLFHQHEPAIMGAALESDCFCEAICDGRHLHPGSVRMLLKCKGWDKVVAVTDSIMAAGLPDGAYKLGVNDVVVVDGDAKLADTGVRAGSTLTTAQALRNLVKFTGRPVEDVLPLLTENPARLLRMDDCKGSLAPGKDADVVLLADDLSVRATIVRGDVVYDGMA
ncbi:MAG: N-acetylglucosamine-6-phosphate deacetylase [Clostridia bacterium]|nr:N-acetylglucosamine-6-phosphate deacetylase [Clostridia bacterium]